MEIRKYEVVLKNEVDKVFKELFEKDIYKEWSKAFVEGSIIEGEIKKDGIVYFYDGDNNGMKGIVKEYKENEKIVFKYLTNIIAGEESPIQYDDNYESYTFTKVMKGW